MSKRNRKSNRAGTRGSSIAEFGPAIVVLLFFIFLPMINLLSLGTIYFACFTLNDLQLKYAAERPESEGSDRSGLVHKGIPEKWAATGLGAFVKPVSEPETVVSYSELMPNTKDKVVAITTTVQTSPLLPSLSLLPNIPGLSAPMRFVLHSERVMERAAQSAEDQDEAI